MKTFFKRTIENIGLKPLLMEYEDLTHQNAGTVIRKRTTSSDCKCLIVLIGKRILFPNGYNYSFTHNWVGFEIGIATCMGIPIVVFEEDSMDFKEIVEFPIPYLDHYVRYKQDTNESGFIGMMLKMLSFNMPFTKEISPQSIKCTYAHCNAKYFYWNRNRILPETMPCPVCRGLFRPGVDEIKTRDSRSDERMPSGVV
ncbi:MAG TPA: hypothetical protein VE130_14000 [Nitrososphaeraceae archaeon]|nr:hypothetical protein [Nitrososphaeraceae archaeon]